MTSVVQSSSAHNCRATRAITARVATVSPTVRWVIALSLGALVLRTIDLASVPEWFTDEGLWAMPARDFVLFSNWAPTGYFHHYLSPLFSGLLAAWFTLVGPGIPQGRLLDTMVGVLTIPAVVLLGAKLGSSSAGLFAAAALAFDGPFTITNRSVLLESLQTLLLVGCAAAGISHTRHRYWFLALLFGGALLTKLLSVYIAPVLIGYAWHRGGRRAAVLETATLCAGGLLAIGGFGAIALSDPTHFWHTWSWEFMLRGQGPALLPGGEEGSLRGSVMHFVTRDPVLLAGLAASLAWLVLRRPPAATVFVAGWIVTGVVAMSIQGYSPPRYYVPLLPFAWLWIMLSLNDMRASGVLSRWERVAVVGILLPQFVYFLSAMGLYYYIQGHRDPYSARLTDWVNGSLPQHASMLAPFRLLVSTRVLGTGWEAMTADRSLTLQDLQSNGIEYVITAKDTDFEPLKYTLGSVQEDSPDITEMAQFGDIRLYHLTSVGQ
jgi:4-amino-4-deoxy-L-arabinose transferase-like glycosyltransferase